MMITFSQRANPAAQLLWPALAASLVLVAAGTGAIAPLVPLACVALAIVLASAPMRVTASALFAIALLVDNPGERPMAGFWRSPLMAPGELLYINLHNHTGIAALRFSALELAIAVLMLVLVVRKLIRDPIDDPLGLGALPNPMKTAFACLFVTTLALEFYGLARHGDFQNSLWQMRQLFWLPILGVLFGHSLKTPAARLWLVRIVIGVACVRALMGIYFYLTIVRPSGEFIPYTTTHSDSVLAVVAMLILMMALVARPSRDHLLLNLLCQPVLMLGLVVNNRRLAFVSLAAGVFAAVALAPASLRRALRGACIAAIPFVLLYAAAGWNSKAAVFRPVSILRSVSSQEDASSQTRDIENYNLIKTLKQHPILGSGFGHEYVEEVQANRVDQVFAQYRFIGHNSVLWLLSVSGWVGFTLMWITFPISAIISLRVFRHAVTPVDQVTAFGAIAAVLCFVLQAWGDMGLQSWMGTLLVSAFAGAAGAMWTAAQREEVQAR